MVVGAVERYVALAVLFVGVVIPPRVLSPGSSRAGTAGRSPDAAAVAVAEGHRVREEARRARARRILGEYLAPDSGLLAPGLRRTLPFPETVPGAARAAWGASFATSGQDVASWTGWGAVAGAPGRNARGARRGAGTASPGSEPSPAPPGLDAYLRLDPSQADSEGAAALVREGDAHAARGEAAAAIAAYDAAAARAPFLADWLHVRSASAAAGAGDTAEVRARLARVDPGLARDYGWGIIARGRIRAGDVAGAHAAVLAVAGSLPDAASRAAAWSLVGDLRRMRGDGAGAAKAYRRAIEAAPLSAGALAGARGLGALAGASPRDRLLAGRTFLRHGNVERGVAGLRAFLESGEASEAEREEVRLELGRALARAGELDRALPVLRVLADSSPVSRVRAGALLELGRAYFRQGKTDEGRATYLALAERHPGELAAAEALFLVADLDHDRGALAAARQRYERAARVRPDTERAAAAFMRLGGLAYAAGDFDGAAAIFEEFRRHHRRGGSAQQASYWAGRAHLARGDSALARERLREAWAEDPFSYHGVRAGELLGLDFSDAPLDASPPPSPRLAAEARTAIARIELLRALGPASAAEFELARLRRHYQGVDGAVYALAEAFNERGLIFDGVRLGWEIFREERVWNPRLLRIVYPFPFRSLIVEEARRRGLDPHLVAGLVRQESMFQPRIRSHAGAVGLMQIMPATGRSLARMAGLGGVDAAALERPEVNVPLGILYLEGLLSAYQGRPLAALAAYNAGPGRVARWRAFPEWADEELFAERIPFAETREYVRVVYRNARLYAALYPIGAPPGHGWTAAWSP